MLRLILAAIFLVALAECNPPTHEGFNAYEEQLLSLKKEILQDIFGNKEQTYEPKPYKPRYPEPRPYYPPPKQYYPPPSYREYSYSLPTSKPSLDQYTTYPVSGDYKIVERGQRNTDSYRIFIANSKGEIVSPWHDIPLFADQAANIFNAVVEISRWVNAKTEISKKEKFNPINQQITSENRLRYNVNVFPYHGYIWNYCSLPQTWLNPNVNVEKLGFPGDDDLLDVVEIGSKIHARGTVLKVKLLGALGFVDGGRLQGEPKIIAIDITDPIAWKLNDIADVETNLPGLLESVKDWFRVYKVPTGVPANFYTNNGIYYNKADTLAIIDKQHKAWDDLIKGVTPNPTLNGLLHTSLIAGSSNQKTPSEASRTITLETKEFSPIPAAVDQAEVEKLAYVDRNKL